MYVTRPLSQLLKSPELAAVAPDGPNSGFLVIQDEESVRYSCFGLCKNRNLNHLPFPQDKELIVKYTVRYTNSNGGLSSHSSHDPIFLIPALNQPLSSNQYYAIVPHRKHIGEALTCSREEDKVSCCFCLCVKDVKSRPLDPRNIYQQFRIVPRVGACTPAGYFVAKSIASDGFPPYFLRRKGWTIYTKTPHTFKLDTAGGIDSELRARLPEFGSPAWRILVGKWYTPFTFVKEGSLSLRDQVKNSMYYEVTLEQTWEQIFKTDHNHSKGNSVVIDATLEKEQVLVGGTKATWNERSPVDGVIWFKAISGGGGEVGLRVELVERMKWEQERGGWMKGKEEREVKINKVEAFEGVWNEFECYVLVERFNLKRMDGSVVMTYDFRHFHHLKTKWE